ncbi:MAG TPA: SRPBCC family protein [Actinomycetota bacterium]|nr:SRPBCC family protein [Actinomycetota bacterium]
MSVVEASVEVRAPQEAVWAVVADPRNLPRWDRHIVGVEGAPEDGLRPGSSYWTRVRFLGVQARVRAEVLELRPPRYARLRLTGIVDGVVETWLDPLDGDQTRLRHRVEYRFPGGSLGRVAARAVRMMGASVLLARGARAQKRQAEEAARA